MSQPEKATIPGCIDVAVLAPGTTRDDVLAACREARDLRCAAVCVAPVWVAEAHRALEGSAVALSAAIGFPLGASTTLAKVFEALECLKHGATELDIVIHVGAARSGDFRSIKEEAREIRKRTPEAVHKFILEMALLPEDALKRAVKAVAASGPAFLKTGTGTVGEVRPEDVARLRKLAPTAIRIKAAGGIRTPEQARDLLAAGADRLGTSTARALLGPSG
ncbi:MAG: deoxyribose-phosphate aldolase [Acidobacteriota bacterium]|jgi:deoxyribose-phosphate aldolase